MRNLTIYMQNCNGIRSKLSDIRANLDICNFDIISLVETKIQDDQLFNAELCPERANFVVFRKDRNLNATKKKGGGGVMVLVDKKYQAVRLPDFEVMEENEDIWLSISLENGYKLLFCTFYLRPQATLLEYEKFADNLMFVVNNANEKTFVFVCGDANAPEIKWGLGESGSIQAIQYEGRIAETLIHTFDACDFKQHNLVQNTNGRILDLCLSNIVHDQVQCQRASFLLCREESHHPAVETSLNLRAARFTVSNVFTQYNYRKANYEMVNQKLMVVDWVAVFSSLDVNRSVSRFYEILHEVIAEFVPKKLVKSDKYPIYFTKQLITEIKKKNRLHKKFMKAKKANLPIGVVQFYYEEFRSCRTRLKELQRKLESEYLSRVQTNARSNIKEFWAYSKSLRKSNSFPQQMKLDGNMFENPQNIADGFADYFNSVHAAVDETLPSARLIVPCNDSFNFSSVTENEVHKVISELNTNKGVGSDSRAKSFNM